MLKQLLFQNDYPKPAVKPPADAACWHPWMRLLARGVDMALYWAVFLAFWAVTVRQPGILRPSPLIKYLGGVLLLAAALLLEAFWLHFWGWTPGKWIFGLKVRDSSGEKLSLKAALRRGMQLGWAGYGWQIPLWGLWRLWQCRQMSLKGQRCPWDADGDFCYTVETRRWRAQLCAAGFLGALALSLAAACLLTKPLARGPLSVEGFAENYNQYHTLLLRRDSGLPRLQPDGSWSVDNWAADNWAASQDGLPVQVGGAARWEEPAFCFSDDGSLCGVILRMESDQITIGAEGFPQETLALLAFSGGLEQGKWGLFIHRWEQVWLGQESPCGSFSAEYQGISIRQEVKAQGYDE